MDLYFEGIDTIFKQARDEKTPFAKLQPHAHEIESSR